MTVDAPKASDSPDRSSDAAIDALCDRFEAAWIGDQQATIEEYLRELEKSARPAALAKLIRVELKIRRDRGELPVADEYQRRFPAESNLIRNIFTLVEEQVIETVAPTQLAKKRVCVSVVRNATIRSSYRKARTLMKSTALIAIAASI